MSFEFRKGFEKLEEYNVQQVDSDIIVNANECNYNVPEKIHEYVNEMIKDFSFNRYPPMESTVFCEAIAKGTGFNSNQVVFGNGSSELLQQACYIFGGPGKKIAYPSPSFSMYGVYTQLSDSIEAPYSLTCDGFIDADKLIAFCEVEKPSLLIICNPNNPTGNYNDLSVIEKILKNVKCPVITDEAYMEFAKDCDDSPKLDSLSTKEENAKSSLVLYPKYNNFLCLRTFSKAYGLAGMRIGYGVGADEIIQGMKKVNLPYSINAVSLKVGEYVYKNKNLYNDRIKLFIVEREKMRKVLEAQGFSVYPSKTNFLLFKPKEKLIQSLASAFKQENPNFSDNSKTDLMLAGKQVFNGFLKQRILVRDFSMHPILQGCLRLSLGTVLENEIIAKAIKEGLK
jgi:histidinol-phosphate aminotransferase